MVQVTVRLAMLFTIFFHAGVEPTCRKLPVRGDHSYIQSAFRLLHDVVWLVHFVVSSMIIFGIVHSFDEDVDYSMPSFEMEYIEKPIFERKSEAGVNEAN